MPGHTSPSRESSTTRSDRDGGDDERQLHGVRFRDGKHARRKRKEHEDDGPGHRLAGREGATIHASRRANQNPNGLNRTPPTPDGRWCHNIVPMSPVRAPDATQKHRSRDDQGWTRKPTRSASPRSLGPIVTEPRVHEDRVEETPTPPLAARPTMPGGRSSQRRAGHRSRAMCDANVIPRRSHRRPRRGRPRSRRARRDSRRVLSGEPPRRREERRDAEQVKRDDAQLGREDRRQNHTSAVLMAGRSGESVLTGAGERQLKRQVRQIE